MSVLCKKIQLWEAAIKHKINLIMNLSVDGSKDNVMFDEEILRFQPILELEEIERSIQSSDLTDVSDVLVEMLRKNGNKPMGRKS